MMVKRTSFFVMVYSAFVRDSVKFLLDHEWQPITGGHVPLALIEWSDPMTGARYLTGEAVTLEESRHGIRAELVLERMF